MTDPQDPGAPPATEDSAPPSAGAMLRSAREKRGVHIAALAAAIKVPQRKLEALEADRYDQLPDLTFTRALAQSVCRSLKIDMHPVLERLPLAGDNPKLSQVGGGINAPFRDRPGRDEPSDRTWLRRPVVWGSLVVLGAAAALALMPERWLHRGARSGAAPASAPAAATPAALAPSASVFAPSASEPGTALGMLAAAPASGAMGPDSVLALKADATTWVEIQDANGQTLLSRHLGAGESAGVDGALPLRVTIGNAAATQLTFRGQAVDLGPSTRDNVARFQLP
jgi:cytoskeleton protein RodZ